MASRSHFYDNETLVRMAREAGFHDARTENPDLEPYAKKAGLPEDVVAVFKGRGLSQLLQAWKAGACP
jgi:hypothetical protein